MNRLGQAREWVKRMSPECVRKSVWRYRDFRELCRFAARQRRLDFQIGDQPWLDEESKAFFLPMLEKSKCYLEYGSGGSTVLAARLNKPFVCIDTDRYFLEAVRRKIGKLAPNQLLVHGNIGWTREFGCPVFKTPSASRRKKWKAYVEHPWQLIGPRLLPDLVMVDGRFRVAAALTSCAHLTNSPESLIVVDDYLTRPYYHVIEKYLRLVGIRGSMAILQPSPASSAKIQNAIDHYSLDWR